MVMAPAAYAADQNTAANYDRITGDTVVVTAARTQKALLDTDASMSVVTTKETQLLNRTSVPELLSTQPGISISSDGTPGAKRVAIRGEDSSRTLVMVNGDRISDQKTKSGAPLLMNPYFVDRIEVIKGPASVLYGSDAIGGVVNVITKKASDKPIAVDVGLNYNSAYSSFTEYMNATGTVDRFHYAVGAFNDNAGDLRIADGKQVNNTAYNARGANADLSYDVTNNVTIGYNAELYVSDSEVGTTTKKTLYKNYVGDISKWDRMKHKIYVNAVDINDYVSAVSASFFYQTNEKDFFNKPLPFIKTFVTNEQKTYGANLQAEFSLADNVYLTTGYEGRYDKASSNSDTDVDMPPRPGQNGKPGTPASHTDQLVDDHGYEQYNHAVYALLTTDITDELTLNTGLRFNYVKNGGGTSSTAVTNTTFESQKPPVVSPTRVQVDNPDDKSDSKLVGSVGLVYRPFEHGAFRANWSQGFRYPTIQELFLTTQTVMTQHGNPDLQPEESDNFEIGFRWDDGKLATDLALFYSKADNYIDALYDPQKPNQHTRSRTYQNISKAETYGAELSVAYLCPGSFEPYANISYLVREYEYDTKTSKNTGTPRWSGNAGLRYYGSNFEIDGYAKFAGRSKEDDIAGNAYLGAYDLAGYTTWNLAASVHFGPEDRFTAYAALENIFDKEYMTNDYIDEPGRSVSLGIRGQF